MYVFAIPLMDTAAASGIIGIGTSANGGARAQRVAIRCTDSALQEHNERQVNFILYYAF